MKSLSNFATRNIAALGWIAYLITIVFIVTDHTHFMASITLVTLSSIATYELGKIFKNKFPSSINPNIYPFLGLYFPVMSMISLYLPDFASLKLPGIAIILTVVFTKQVLLKNMEEINQSMIRVTSTLFALFYPGFFLGYFVMLNNFSNASAIATVYLLIITLNDGMAYYVGRTFGKMSKTQGILMVSPNKSLVGFIGGLTASMLTTLWAYLFFAPANAPQMFGNRGLGYALLMGLACGFASIAGDLFESVLKRSSNVKDSGNIIPGRGGVLDTMDSLAFAAPIYYLFLYFA